MYIEFIEYNNDDFHRPFIADYDNEIRIRHYNTNRTLAFQISCLSFILITIA